MKRYINVYFASIRNAIRATMTYRANFLLDALVSLLSNIILPLVTILVYNSGSSFEGWSMYEVLLIQSIFTISSGVADMFFSGIVWTTMHHVAEGTLEIVLIKPVSCLFFLLSTTFSLSGTFVVLGGAALMWYAAAHCALAGALGWLTFALLFLLGVCVMLGVHLLMAAISFKWVANSRIPEIFQSVGRFGSYPATIFPKSVTAVAAFVIPVMMIGFIPAAALLGRTEPWMLLAMLPCVLFTVLGVLVYRHMVKLYEGVGG